MVLYRQPSKYNIYQTTFSIFWALSSTIYSHTLLPSINHSELDLVMTKRYLVSWFSRISIFCKRILSLNSFNQKSTKTASLHLIILSNNIFLLVGKKLIDFVGYNLQNTTVIIKSHDTEKNLTLSGLTHLTLNVLCRFYD